MSGEVQDQSHLVEENQRLREELQRFRAAVGLQSNPFNEEKNRFSLVLSDAKEAIWDWDLLTDEVYYSARWKTMLGYDASELSATLDTWMQLVHPDDKQPALDRVYQYLSGERENYDVEFRMKHKRGHYVYVSARAIGQQVGPDGRPQRLVGTHLDITDRKKAEEYRQRTNEIFKMIALGKSAAEIYDAIALMYESRHPGLRCSMLELSGDTLLHGGAPSMPEEYCQAVHGLINGPNVGSCGASTYTGERYLAEDIETDPNWAELKEYALPHGMRCCWSEPIKSAAGVVLGAFGMYYDYPALPDEGESEDLTAAAQLAGIVMERDHNLAELHQHREHLEQLVAERTRALERAKQEALLANQAKSQFLTHMSHELRTPLNAILGFSQILEMDQRLNPEQKEQVVEVSCAGRHLLELVNEVLDLAHIESGKYQVRYMRVEINPIILACVKLVDAQLAARDISLSHELQEGLIVVGDPIRIKQVILNLLSNAVKYNKEGGSISIKALSISSTQVCVDIADTGQGIPTEKMSELFEPFRRLSNNDPAVEGTGIGLTLTKLIVELMNGTISVDSELGQGSTFSITLPKASA